MLYCCRISNPLILYRTLLIGLIICQISCNPGPNRQEASVTHAQENVICGTNAAVWAQTIQSVDSLYAHQISVDNIPGAALGIVCRDSLVWSKGYGVMALDNATPVSPATLFRIASVTKVFTAMAIMKLVEEGTIDLDDPVHKYLPWFQLQRPAATGQEEVRIRHLLTHTGGVPRDSRLTDFDNLYQPSHADAVAALPDQTLENPPGETYAYSNLGYGVLGAIVAEVSGRSYAAFLEQDLFQPLGMEHSIVHPSPADHTAWGHGPLTEEGTRPKAGFWELGFATPAGGMASSVHDLSKFVMQQLSPYTDSNSPVLAKATIREMQQVQHMIDPSRGGAGYAWGVEISDDQHLVYHSGELPEQSSIVLIDLKNQLGVILLTNAQGIDTNKLALDILALL